VFENRMLRRIFEPKREEVTEGQKKFRSEELHNLYSSPTARVISDRSVRMRMNVTSTGEVKYVGYTILVS
jgi:hypothetical protein